MFDELHYVIKSYSLRRRVNAFDWFFFFFYCQKVNK